MHEMNFAYVPVCRYATPRFDFVEQTGVRLRRTKYEALSNRKKSSGFSEASKWIDTRTREMGHAARRAFSNAGGDGGGSGGEGGGGGGLREESIKRARGGDGPQLGPAMCRADDSFLWPTEYAADEYRI